MKKPKNTSFKGNIFVAISKYLKPYSYTERYVMADVFYHIVTKGLFNTAPQASTNRTGVNRFKTLATIQKLVKDGLLVITDGVQPEHIAVTFNLESKVTWHHQLNSAYWATFRGQGKSAVDDITIVSVNPKKLPNGEAMVGKKAEHERSKLSMEQFIASKMAGANTNEFNYTYQANYYTELAKTFGLCVNTTVKLLNNMVEKGFISLKRNLRKLFIVIGVVGGNGFKKRVDDKTAQIVDGLIEKRRTERQQPRYKPKPAYG